jgi:hypothetical protein
LGEPGRKFLDFFKPAVDALKNELLLVGVDVGPWGGTGNKASHGIHNINGGPQKPHAAAASIISVVHASPQFGQVLANITDMLLIHKLDLTK